tara:strand:- start:82842 stop:84527 length:1686 start_codon:yes stop_codon:yes gene_type:complete
VNENVDEAAQKAARIEEVEAAIARAESDEAWSAIDKLYNELWRTKEPTAVQLGRQAIAVFHLKDVPRAATMTRRAVRLAPENAHLRRQLGKLYFELGRFDVAEKEFRTAMDLEPDHPETLRRLSQIIQKDKESRAEAEELLIRATELAPDEVIGWLQLGALYGNEKYNFKKAEAAFEHALEISPNAPSALHNYGLLKRFQGDLEAAEKYLERACEVYPNDSDFAFSLGTCHMFKEDNETALTWFRRAVELNPHNNAAQVYIAFSLFLLGRMREGWAQYDKRLDLAEFKTTNYERPRWDGTDLEGKTLLMLSEQGMGDNIQFVRYAPIAAKMNGEVIVLTHESLARLFKSLDGVNHVVTSVPEPRHFHRYCPLMSAPLALGTDENTIPGVVPYLTPPAEDVEKWAEKLAPYTGKKIGLCWRGNPKHVHDHFRSSSLEEMQGLLDIEGATFFSLHKDRTEDEQELPDGLIDIGSEFGDFADTAAAMLNLDLVISVDTSVCHVAGAIGAPVWTMIARGPDFRWGLEAETSPWYPTMKLLRQKTLGDWSDVYARMRADISKLAVE